MATSAGGEGSKLRKRGTMGVLGRGLLERGQYSDSGRGWWLAGHHIVTMAVNVCPILPIFLYVDFTIILLSMDHVENQLAGSISNGNGGITVRNTFLHSSLCPLTILTCTYENLIIETKYVSSGNALLSKQGNNKIVEVGSDTPAGNCPTWRTVFCPKVCWAWKNSSPGR